MTTDVVAARGYRADLFAGQARPAASPAQPTLAWLKALRAEATERVGVLRMPTPHDEAWRFTDISTLTRLSFHPLRTPTALRAGDIERFHIDEAATRLVFVDGVHAPHLSSVGVGVGVGVGDAGAGAGDAALVVGNLASTMATHGLILQAHLGRHAAFHDKPFAALNTAFLHDAAVIIVPRDTTVATPVHLLFIATQAELGAYPRALLVAEPGSAVTLIEDYVALCDGAYFNNSVAEVALGANATVEHVRVQRESGEAFHIASCAVSLAHASRYRSVNIALGARTSRIELHVRHSAAATECSLDGLALIGERQVADTHTFVDHAEPHGMSRQLHKTIVDGAAHAVFCGRVTVRPGAQQTDSTQSSRNLLLSAKARVDTLPQLEIFADDVKCTHGATVGRLDREEIFYLRSRGLSEAAARRLLTHAFCAEVINRIPVASLRRRLEQTVLERTTTPQP